MEQHPVPQHISSYQFRLVGDMTLKQFFQVAGGGLVSLLFYSSPLPSIIKWPLIVFFALFGAALAFLPLEERPLEQWIAAFFKSIYSPTIFYWKKTTKQPTYFQAEPVAEPSIKQEPLVAEEQIDRSTIPRPISRLEEAEQAFLTSITNLSTAHEPKPPTQDVPKTMVQEEKLVYAPKKAGLQIPTTIPVQIPKSPPMPQSRPPSSQDIKISAVKQTLPPQQAPRGQVAQFSASASPPSPPTRPNTIVGQVLDSNGKIVEAAILEIKDTQGRPVRALKTNKAGHFWIATPLVNGEYKIIIEKEGLNFEPLIFEAMGAIIPPLSIRANITKN